MCPRRQRVSRILAVGNPPPDHLHRLTRGRDYVCVSGSEREHRRFQQVCEEIVRGLGRAGLNLGDVSPAELVRFLEATGKGTAR